MPLLALSIRAPHADPERIGRFDPEWRRARMRAGFDPETMRVIELDGAIIGCRAVVPAADHLEIHSFSMDPPVQGSGLGAEPWRGLLRRLGSPHFERQTSQDT